MKKVFLLTVVAVPLMLLLGIWLVWGRTYVVELNQSELQSALEKAFPVEKTYLLVVKVEMSQPALKLEERSDRIRLASQVKVGLLDTRASSPGTAEVSCLIRYDAARGAFFADDPKVERLTIDGHSQSHLERTMSAIAWILKGVFEQTPIYTLRPEDTRQSFAKLLLKDVRVKNGKLRLTLGVGT